MKKILYLLVPVAAILAGLAIFFTRNITFTAVSPLSSDGVRLESLSLPPGFKVSLYARVPGARSLALGDDGTLFIGTRGDKLYAARDTNGDMAAETVTVLAHGLVQPNGVAFRDGDLYVAEISRLLKFPDIEADLDNPPAPVTIRDDYPNDEHHGWKYIAFGPDGYLYVPIGAPCNVCLRDDPRYASITRIKPDGSDFSIYAQGIRNTVGFDWNPKTDILWFTENGRDWMGDNQPPDELNRAPEAGLNFGFPFCHGDTPDPDHTGKPCSDFTPPALKLPAHVAALGMKFVRPGMFPPQYSNHVLIAEHGSWNRSSPIGYRVTMAQIKDGRATNYQTFAQGWLQNSTAWGRPVDLLFLPDGSLLISDDRAGAVYRVTY